MNRHALTFFLGAVLIALVFFATSAHAQDRIATPEMEVIALSAEDAETCKQGCQMITPAARAKLADMLQRGAQMEALAREMAKELDRLKRARCT